MFYFNTKTKEFGIPFQDAKRASINLSVPDNTLEFGDFVSYEFSNQPNYDPITQGIREIEPVNRVQQWEVYDLDQTTIDQNKIEYKQRVFTQIKEQVQLQLDNFAASKQYDSITSACSYANSSIPTFQVEGQRCVTLRDQTWTAVLKIFNDIDAGIRPMPIGYEDISTELPVLSWV